MLLWLFWWTMILGTTDLMIDIPERFRKKKSPKIPARYRKKPALSLDIDSNALADAYWKNGDLYVTFARDGAQYIFHDVPRSVAKELEDADSQGEYFNDFIRDEYDYD